MPVEVLVPKLGMTMTEGTVAEWHRPDGAEVRKGDRIYRLETEKIEFEVEAEADGVLRYLVAKGAKLPPGAVVGYILAPGEALPAGAGATPTPAEVPVTAASVALAGGVPGEARVVASPIARRLASEARLVLASISGTGPGGRITEADVRRSMAAPSAQVPAPQPATTEVLASPLARGLARALGVDLERIQGTGPGGRITKEDVEAAAASRSRPAPSAAAPGEVIPLRAMRRTIAQRMHASLQEMAQLTMAMEVGMNEAIRLRNGLIEEWAAEGIRPSFTDLVIKAVAKALGQHPLLNASLTPEGIVIHPAVHVGMAVALDDGLVVPVIRDAGVRPLKEIARETSRVAGAARSGSLAIDEMSGGTFSVTALGMAGIGFFTPIINPPNVAILGVGRIHDAVAWEADRPVRVQRMTLSLTIDHRVVDGAPGAAFLGTVRDLLEAPYRLLV